MATMRRGYYSVDPYLGKTGPGKRKRRLAAALLAEDAPDVEVVLSVTVTHRERLLIHRAALLTGTTPGRLLVAAARAELEGFTS
jgi:hypothetical protein